MEFVGLALGCALLVVDTGHNSGISVHADFEFGHFRKDDFVIGVSRVRNVSGLAEGASVLHGDDEIVRQKRIQAGDIASLIGVIPLVFEREDLGDRLGIPLSGSEQRSEWSEEQKEQ
jgi:hypothetical protein